MFLLHLYCIDNVSWNNNLICVDICFPLQFLLILQISCSGWSYRWSVCICGSEEDQAQCWESNIHICEEYLTTNRFCTSLIPLVFHTITSYLYNALYIYMFISAAMLSAIYEENKDEDGFLYMTYSGENTFGFPYWSLNIWFKCVNFLYKLIYIYRWKALLLYQISLQ